MTREFASENEDDLKKMVDVKPKSEFTQIKMVNPDTKVRFSEQVEMNSHLYKLVEAKVIKYIGKGTDRDKYPDTTPEDFLEMGHAHVFRTIDSDGVKHLKSVPIGGHYHLIQVELDPADPEAAPKIISMSGPMQTVHKRVKGRMTATDEPINSYDDHTHDVQYIKSERIQGRVANKEAKEFLSKESSKVPSAPSGVGQPGSR